jgi:RTX calcium-binding nonapeptide repeat (4 copies)
MSGSRGGAAALGGALVGLLAVSGVALNPAAAAQLRVTAAPIQTWRVTDLPEPPDPSVDLNLCGDVSAYDEIVYGTDGDDQLEAGNGRQILVGLAGDDTLSGGNHDDCLIGGEGDDRLYGDNGRDLLFGQVGADALDGGTGKDLLDAGGDVGDTCSSNGAPDVRVGCDPLGRPDEIGTALTQTAGENPDGPAGAVSEPEQDQSDEPSDGTGDEPTVEPTDEGSDEPIGEPAGEPTEEPTAENSEATPIG